MGRKVIAKFRISPKGLTSVSPDAGPPEPKGVTFVRGQPPPELQRQMDAFREASRQNVPVESGWLTATIEEPDENSRALLQVRQMAPRLLVDMEQNDPAMFERFQQQGGLQPAMTLAKLRHIIGGDEGDWIVPRVPYPVPVSLQAWANSDPETTHLHVTFQLRPNRDDLTVNGNNES